MWTIVNYIYNPVKKYIKSIKKILKFRKFRKILIKDRYVKKGTHPPSRSLIYMIDELYSYAGFTDRLKGMVTGKYLADQLSLSYGIYIKNKEYDVYKYLALKKGKYLFDQSGLEYSNFSKPFFLINFCNKNRSQILKMFKRYPQNHLYCNLDLLPVMNTTLHSEELSQMWHLQFHELWDISSFLTEKFDTQKRQLQPSIGFHLRFVNALGDFQDVFDNELDLDQKSELVTKAKQAMAKIIAAHPEVKLIYVFSDSQNFLNILRSFKVESHPGFQLIMDTNHIGHSGINKNEQVLFKTIKDFFSLSLCHKIYSIANNQMHQSDFPKYASYIYKRPFELVQI